MNCGNVHGELWVSIECFETSRFRFLILGSVDFLLEPAEGLGKTPELMLLAHDARDFRWAFFFAKRA